MSNTDEEYAREEGYSNMLEELSPRVIEEHISEKLVSYYKDQPKILNTFTNAFYKAEKLLNEKHFSASLVFSASAIEIAIKNVLLKPLIFGQINNSSLADSIVENALSQTGFKRYKKLVYEIFQEITGLSLSSLLIENSKQTLFSGAVQTQELRNSCLHNGVEITEAQAEWALSVARGVFLEIIVRVLTHLDIEIESP
jgi:hypothetical protein